MFFILLIFLESNQKQVKQICSVVKKYWDKDFVFIHDNCGLAYKFHNCINEGANWIDCTIQGMGRVGNLKTEQILNL